MNQINLVPIEYKKRHRRKWYILFGALGSGVSCMILITLALIPVFQIKIAEQEHAALTAALESKEIVETKLILSETTAAHGRNAEAAKLLEKLDVPSYITRQTMDIVVGSVPKGLRMNQVVMEKSDNSIVIDGNAHSITKVAQYIVQLYNTGQFDILDYTANSNQDSKIVGWVDYNIRIKPRNILTDEEIRAAEAAKAAEEAAAAATTEEGEVETREESGGEDLL